jgi:regulator of protease activity HflC (stomatin/prohibitin superfamily)
MNPRSASSPAGIISVLLFALAAGSFYFATISGMAGLYGVAVVFVLIGLLTPLSMQMANQWEKAVVLRLGRLQGIKGPGIFFIVPFVDSVTVWIDQRIQTTEFNAEQALTRDTVPTNIDAIHPVLAGARPRAGGAGDHRLPPGDRPRRPDIAA